MSQLGFAFTGHGPAGLHLAFLPYASFRRQELGRRIIVLPEEAILPDSFQSTGTRIEFTCTGCGTFACRESLVTVGRSARGGSLGFVRQSRMSRSVPPDTSFGTICPEDFSVANVLFLNQRLSAVVPARYMHLPPSIAVPNGPQNVSGDRE